MTCSLNEAACIAFTVGALVDQVDLYVLIDTGSTDGTEQLVRTLYQRQIAEGRLVFEQLGALPDYDISLARNRAVEILQEHKIDYLIKVDGDDVFYDAGARHIVEEIRYSPENLSGFYCRNYELYQWETRYTLDWLKALHEKRDIFWQMGFKPAHPRVCRVEGAIARGRWTDEAQGSTPEGVGSDVPGIRRGTWKLCAAHYGWAKPVALKEEKIRIWSGEGGSDPRVEHLHLIEDPRRPLRPFTKHPEIVERKIDLVRDFLADFEHK